MFQIRLTKNPSCEKCDNGKCRQTNFYLSSVSLSVSKYHKVINNIGSKFDSMEKSLGVASFVNQISFSCSWVGLDKKLTQKMIRGFMWVQIIQIVGYKDVEMNKLILIAIILGSIIVRNLQKTYFYILAILETNV